MADALSESAAKKAEVIARIRGDGLVPILRTQSAEDALELADVMREAGVRSLEIPLTVPGALDVIRELAVSFSPDLVVGAGTVLNIEHALGAHDAGARFIVTPIFDGSVIGFCRANGIACFPGALTPTEIYTAWNAGADAVKVFPASAVGGAEYLHAIKAPLPDIEVMPTGGVTIANAAAYILAGALALGVGGELTDMKPLREGRRSVAIDRVRLFLDLIKDAREAHRRPATRVPPAPLA
jgi:2-dehydro-3-deoxyphosphogluconate aldolase/(4S)-4-hydroxy-2-oxoglutarate aldolase